jgi:class 3 adenylate cyclase/tetratricopeptide (TPR) repeat protein
MSDRTHSAAKAQATARPVGSADGELRLVTVLFADIVDSTALIAELDPEGAAELLAPALRIICSTIERFEGTIIRVAGDGVLAVFGAPAALEDHAARACHAARALLAANVETRGAASDPRGMAFRIGLNSGDVLFSQSADLAGRAVQDVAGAAVHLAVRMEQAAEPNSIRITRSTRRLVDRLFKVAPLGKVTAKGFAEPIELFALGEPLVLPAAGVSMGARGGFVGRDAEVRALASAATEAREGRGRAVAIVGESGIGKSWLVSQFLASRTVEGFSAMRAGAASTGEANANQALFDLIGRLFGFSGSASALMPAESEAESIGGAPMRAALRFRQMLRDEPADVPHWRALSPEDRRHHRAQAFFELLRLVTQSTPLVLVVEDLHWADEETRALLDATMPRMATLRVLLIVTYRPDHGDRWVSHGHASRLQLDPFPDADARRLLIKLLGNDAGVQHLPEKLVAMTGGNPLFIAESVHSLSEAGYIVGAPGAFRAGKAVSRIDVPASVHSIIAARLDRRSVDDRHLLQVAATLGVRFRLALLARLLGEGPDAVAARLQKLAEAALVRQIDTDADAEYGFAHALIRDEVYQRMVKSRRRAIHAQVFAALLDADRGEIVERLAYHSTEAGLSRESVSWNRMAASRARFRAADGEAVGYLEAAARAVAEWPPGDERDTAAIDIRLEMRVPYYASGRIEALLEHAMMARELAKGIGDSRRLALATSLVTLCRWRRGAFDEALATASETLALAAKVDDLELAVLANFGLGQVRHALGEYRESIEPLRAVMTLAGAVPDRNDFVVSRHAVHARAILSVSLVEIGEFGDASNVAAEALHIARDLGDGFAEAFARFASGYVFLRAGELRHALRVLEPGLDASLAGRGGGFLAFLAATSGVVLVKLGDVEKGIALVDRAGAALGRHRASHFQLPYALQAEAYLAAGRATDAMRAADECAQMCRQRRERGYECWSLTIAGEAALAKGDRDSARHRGTEGATLADSTGQVSARARCAAVLLSVRQ